MAVTEGAIGRQFQSLSIVLLVFILTFYCAYLAAMFLASALLERHSPPWNIIFNIFSGVLSLLLKNIAY
jgi:hypothetical protein